MRTAIGPWEILTDDEVEQGWMCIYNYGRIFVHPHDLPKAVKAVAKLDPPAEHPSAGRTMVELEPTQKLEIIEVEELSNECELCHAVMSVRDGVDPTKVCDNCAQAFYTTFRNKVQQAVDLAGRIEAAFYITGLKYNVIKIFEEK